MKVIMMLRTAQYASKKRRDNLVHYFNDGEHVTDGTDEGAYSILKNDYL